MKKTIMQKMMIVLVVLMFVGGMSMTVYAQGGQSEIDAANEQAAADAAREQAAADAAREQAEREQAEREQAEAEAGAAGVDDGVRAQQEAMENANAGWLYADGLPGRGTIEMPGDYWERNGYPDNVSFACVVGDGVLEDGTAITYWEIGIVNTDEASKQEILDLLSPNCIVTFRGCAYSHNQGEAARNEILAMNDEKIIDVVLMGNSDGILVIVSEDSVAYYRETLSARFGDIVSVGGDESTPVEAAASDGNGTTDTDLVGDGSIPVLHGDPISNGGFNNKWILPVMLILLCGVAAALYFNRARFVPAMQMNSGTVVAGNVPISRKQTIALIKGSAMTPPDDVFMSIMEKIDTAKSGG